MIYLNLAILLLFLAAFGISFRNTEDWFKSLNKAENKLYPLYPLSSLILKKTRLCSYLNKKKDVAPALKALSFTGKSELVSWLYWCKRVSLVLFILVIVNLMSVIAFLTADNNSRIIDGRYIRRPGQGEGSRDIEVQVSMVNKDPSSQDGQTAQRHMEITIPIDEQSYSRGELDEVFKEAFAYLQENVLGSNQSAENINRDLNFIKAIPGTGIEVDWIPEDYSLIGSDGRIKNSNLSPGGVWTDVTAILTYRNNDTELSREQSFSFQIMPREYSEEEIVKQELKEKITQADIETEEDQYFELPKSLKDYLLVWNEKRQSSGTTLLILGVVLAATVWILSDRELEKGLKLRKEQLMIDYPELINKFTLLINAGMTIKQAWLKIADDYDSKLLRNKDNRRYVYEEILVTARELKLGIPENIAYEQFGKRAGLTAYLKFSSLISQNLMKGTKGFTELLIHEAAEAFEERKETVKRLGEIAGTKLLIPMMILLIMVLFIIMIPAFLSFRIQG